MPTDALAAIQEYYPSAEVGPVMFRGERIGFAVYLESEDEPLGFSSDPNTAAKRARELLVAGGSLPE